IVTNDSLFFFSSRRRHTRFDCDWSSDVCSSDLDESQESPPRLALPPIVACLMVTLVKTQSRGGFLGFVAVALYLLVWFDGMSPVKRWGAVAVPVLLLVALGNGSYFERMQTLLNPSADYNWSGDSETGCMQAW